MFQITDHHLLTSCRAGDAAHSFPPTGGLGLNCGLADVHNLAFKLAAVHQGWGTDKLLESYGVERKQVAQICSTQSVKNGKRIFAFLKALGTANIDDPDEAREQLLRSISDPDKQEPIRINVEGQREHFDNVSGSEINISFGS
jgi:2-polyprenyl-6-methoxyphenol hydroxylase-like FAD-dependent oxidoreductase